MSFAITSNWTLLIDGRSASGKSSLATRLHTELSNDFGVSAQLVRLDDCYPGWSGLCAGADHVIADVLLPRVRGEDGAWRRWDWADDTYAETHIVRASTPLIVEGCGILTGLSSRLCDWSIWMDAPADQRYARAILRDGASYAPYWDMWARQEAEHIALQQPKSLASQVINTLL